MPLSHHHLQTADFSLWETAFSTPCRFSELGTEFYTQVPTTPVTQPALVDVNLPLMEALGLDVRLSRNEDFLLRFSGSLPQDQSQTIATVYSGHQFGVWAGQLGDGRALLLGELPSAAGLQEIQLKGAGLTPYSRMGDGRAVLRSSIREYLCSEAMHALGVPTSRALCLTSSSTPVRRETMETAALVTRVAPSFIRFGHFQHFASRQQVDALKKLADFVIANYLPNCLQHSNPYAALLESACLSTAEMLTHWQAVGFCHGVMNTDNMSILGLTIDYGPFGFMEDFNPDHICNHTDQQGRYAYAQQPVVANWNLHCLANALLPLIRLHATDEDNAVTQARAALIRYPERYEVALHQRFCQKLGLSTTHESDAALVAATLKLLETLQLDFTHFFRGLTVLCDTPERPHPLREQLTATQVESWDAWQSQYIQRLQLETTLNAQRKLTLQRTNPKYILRNHLAEQAIRQAQDGDYSEVQRLRLLLESPYDDDNPFAKAEDTQGAPAWAQGIALSCSS